MAVDKLVDSTQLDADLTSVADAIRTKGNTSALLSFPEGFVSAVEAIETGGGGYSADGIAANTEPSGHVELSNSVKSIGNSAFYNKPLTTIHAPEVTTIAAGAFSYSGLTVLDDASFPKYTSNITKCFNNSKLKTIKNTKLTKIQVGVFESCTLLETVCLPNVTAISGGAGFRYDAAITLFDCKNKSFAGYELSNAANLTTMILRRTDSVVSLANATNCLQGTPVQGKDGKTCTIYVPSALVETYKTAANWSHWYDLGYVNFAALEGSQYESPTWWEDSV